MRSARTGRSAAAGVEPHRLPLGRGARPRRALSARDQHPAGDDADLARAGAGGAPRHVLRRAGALDGGGRLVLPVKRRPARPPRPGAVAAALPAEPAVAPAAASGGRSTSACRCSAGVLATWTVLAQYDLRGQVVALVDAAAREDRRAAAVHHHRDRRCPGVSRDLAEQIRVAAFVRAAGLEPRARRRTRCASGSRRSTRWSGRGCGRCASGVLEIRAVERVPVVVWRSPDGHRAAGPGRRAGRRGGQPGAPTGPAADRRRRRRRRTCRRRWRSCGGRPVAARGPRARCGSASGAGISCSTATRW